MTAAPANPIVITHGSIETASIEDAVEKLEKIAASAHRRVLSLSVRLDHYNDPAREHPYQVEMTLDLDGTLLRAHRSAAAMSEAIDATADRLQRQMRSRADRMQTRQRRGRDGSWHHGDAPDRRRGGPARTASEPTIVRRKTYALGVETIEEALDSLDNLDHDFYLFSNADTGEDNVVYRDGDGYGIIQPTPTPGVMAILGLPIRQGHAPAPMSSRDACDILDATNTPFVFHLEPDSGRGRVVYRRYDGNYGEITPASAATPRS